MGYVLQTEEVCPTDDVIDQLQTPPCREATASVTQGRAELPAEAMGREELSGSFGKGR